MKGMVAALLIAGSAPVPAACPSAAPVAGSAPAILAGLAPGIVALAGGAVTLAPPYGPPQGRADPRLAEFLTGRRGFALMTRAVAEADLATFRAHHAGRSPFVLPVAAGNWNRFGYVDAVTFVVHPANSVRTLSLAQLDAIFSATRARGGVRPRYWRDLGVTGAAGRLPVRVVGGGSWSGEESARALAVRAVVFGRRGRWRPVPDSGDDGDVVARVARDPAAIGFTGMGHVAGVRPVAVDGIALTAASARSGRYPLLRTVDLLFDAPGGRIDPRVRQLARALLSPAGQQLIAAQGDVAALPATTLARARRMLARLRPAAACPPAMALTRQ